MSWGREALFGVGCFLTVLSGGAKLFLDDDGWGKHDLPGPENAYLCVAFVLRVGLIVAVVKDHLPSCRRSRKSANPARMAPPVASPLP